MDTMYNRIEELCRKSGTNVTAMCRELKISRSSLSELKAGRTKALSIQYTARICRYFQIPAEYLLPQNEPLQDDAAEKEDDVLSELVGLLCERPELQSLLLVCKNLSKRDILVLSEKLQNMVNEKRQRGASRT